MSMTIHPIALQLRNVRNWSSIPTRINSYRGTTFSFNNQIVNIRSISTRPQSLVSSSLYQHSPYPRAIGASILNGAVNNNSSILVSNPGALVVNNNHHHDQQRTFASRKSPGHEQLAADSEEDQEEYVDDNGMTMKEREKIEKWANNFTKESIPKGLLTLNFVRSSGPGGQNVNKVNTKVDMRFVVDDAVWLPEYVRDRLKSQESNKINKSGEYVLQSDRKRTQMANLDDCMEKLHEVLMEMAQLPKLPDAESLEKLERIRKAANNRRKANKQFQSQKKSSRRVSRDD